MKNIAFKSLTFILGLAAFTSCSSSESADSKTKNKPEKKHVATKIGTVTAMKVGEHVQLPGEFLAFQEVSIYPKADGFVEKVLVDRGSKVSKGQVLMVLKRPRRKSNLWQRRPII